MAIVEEHEIHETKTGPNGSTATVNRPEEPTMRRETPLDQETMLKTFAGGSMGTAGLGIAAIVLSILGLARLWPITMVELSVILLGAASLLDTASVGARFASLLGGLRGGLLGYLGLGGGLGLGILAGASAIVLGILALLGVAQATLMSSALITLGSVLVLGSGLAARLEALSFPWTGQREEIRELGNETAAASAGFKSLIGLAAIVLGVVSLLVVPSLPLHLAATLILGFAMLVSGGIKSLASTEMVRSRDYGRPERK